MKTFVNLLFLCCYLSVLSVCAHASVCSSSSAKQKKIKLYTTQVNRHSGYGSLDVVSPGDDDLLCRIEDEDDEYENKKCEPSLKDRLTIFWPALLNGVAGKSIIHYLQAGLLFPSPLYISQRVLRI